MQHPLVSKINLLPQQKEWNLSVDQEVSKPTKICEEQENVCTSQEREQLHEVEVDMINFPFTVVIVKSENDDEQPQSSQLHQSQTVASKGAEHVGGSSTGRSALKIETYGEDCRGSQAASNSGPDDHLQQPPTDARSPDCSETDNSYEWKQNLDPHSDLIHLRNCPVPCNKGPVETCNGVLMSTTQRSDTFTPASCESKASDDIWHPLLRKIDMLPHQQNWNPIVDQESKATNIKEEQEKHWTSHKEQQFQQLEEDDITKVPLTVLPVKSENDEVDPQSSQLRQNQTDDRIEVEHLSRSSTEHSTVKIEANGEDCGGSQPTSNSGLCGRVQTDTDGQSSDCSENDTDDNCQWNQNLETSDLMCLKNCAVSVRDRCNVVSSECGKTFGHINYATTHKRIRSSEKPCNCPVCGKIFGRKSHLNIHMRIHTGEKPFVCSECGESFREIGNLKRHMRIHTGEKPFGCSECGKRFRQKGCLNKHVRIHTGEKPFCCYHCSRGFREMGALNKHIRIHTGEKPFGCSECGKNFRQKSILIKHMRIHTGQKPFGCSECGKGFRGMGELNKHFRIHTGEKPFSCSECGDKFRQKNHLTAHMRIHTRDKSFCCSKCGERFSQRGCLNRHRRIHAGKKTFGFSECNKTTDCLFKVANKV